MKLTLVSTPIGNLGDITLRAIESLKLSDLVICEDTRVTKSLCQKLGIELKGQIISFNDHSDAKIPSLIKKIKASAFAVLVSDAGSPIISDPALPLIKACLDEDIIVDSNPGASSVVMALELSGLPSSPFTFHGFLSRTKGEIEKSLLHTSSLGGTHIYFESPHRIHQTVTLMKKSLPQAQVAICRELSKKFQSVYRGYVEELRLEDIEAKGEFAIVLYEETKKTALSSDVKGLVDKFLDKSTDKNLSKLLAALSDKKSKEIYEILLSRRS